MRYPEIRVKLRTKNALALVAAVRQEMRRAGLTAEEIERFSEDALASDDTRQMRRICSEWVNAR